MPFERQYINAIQWKDQELPKLETGKILSNNGNKLQWVAATASYTDAQARTAISEAINGISYDNITGIFSLTAGYVIPTTTEQSNWGTTFGWGNHASAGYLTAETDPVYSANTYAVNMNQGVATTDTPQFAKIKIDNASTYIDKDGSGNMTFTDIVVGTRTLAEMDCPKIIYISGQTLTDNVLANISDGTNWNVNKSILTTILITTLSTDWDLFIYSDNDSVSGVYANYQIIDSWSGNKNIQIYLPYIDNDVATQIHIKFVDNTAANTATVTIMGVQAR